MFCFVCYPKLVRPQLPGYNPLSLPHPFLPWSPLSLPTTLHLFHIFSLSLMPFIHLLFTHFFFHISLSFFSFTPSPHVNYSIFGHLKKVFPLFIFRFYSFQTIIIIYHYKNLNFREYFIYPLHKWGFFGLSNFKL